jgi:nucleotide-binding universal stress UspA family protein
MKPDLPDDLAQLWRKAAQAYLDKRLGDLAASGAADVEGLIVAGDAFGAIIGEAARRRVGLIVIGAPASRGYSDLFVGTTAERVIRFSDTPVLMVRREASGPYRRILSAFDGSEGSVRALKTAMAIAPKAEFRVVHAWRPPQTSVGDAETARSAIERENESLGPLIHKAATDALSSAGGSLAIGMIEDNPFVAIAQSRAESSWPLCGLPATPCAKHPVAAISTPAAASAIEVACFTSDPPIVCCGREGLRIHPPHGGLSAPDARIGS